MFHKNLKVLCRYISWKLVDCILIFLLKFLSALKLIPKIRSIVFRILPLTEPCQGYTVIFIKKWNFLTVGRETT